MMNETTPSTENATQDEPAPNGNGGGAMPDPDLQIETASMAEDLSQVQRQRDEYFEQLQRSRAEFANYQKRSKTQAEADRLYAVGSLARDFLDSIDNLERATEALRSSASPGIAEGLDMVQKQMLAILAKHGVEPIAALGDPFDPAFHEAITQQPSAEHPEGTVVAELSKGYRIRDRVLRPTRVSVSVKPV
ncbi:MAG: nucleotide exchange factor GrpE [Isosphaeraceae bacterium]|nr:nucleotide exchange factor GrpE [Isosphaeraceae bacterium]